MSHWDGYVSASLLLPDGAQKPLQEPGNLQTAVFSDFVLGFVESASLTSDQSIRSRSCRGFHSPRQVVSDYSKSADRVMGDERPTIQMHPYVTSRLDVLHKVQPCLQNNMVWKHPVGVPSDTTQLPDRQSLHNVVMTETRQLFSKELQQ